MRRLLLILLVLAGLGAAAWTLWPKPVAVETAVIAARDLDVDVEEEGKTRIREVYTVSAPISGQLLRLALHAGDHVNAGETIVASIKPVPPGLLDARARKIAEAAIDAAAAAVDLAVAQEKQAEAQLEFMSGDLARAKELVGHGTIAQRAFDKAVADEAVARADVERAKANLLVRQRELESAKAALIETGSDSDANCCIEVKAPVTGTVLRVLTENEQVVPAGTPLIEFGDPHNMEVVVDLLSRDAVRVVPEADATIESWGGKPLKATVTRVEPAAVTKVSALGIEEQRVSVVLRLDDPPEQWLKLGHGFRVVVRIRLWHGRGLIAVPIGALFRQGADWACFTVKDGAAHLARLGLGERNDEYAEVKSGLAAGDTVILHPGDAVQDGVRVTY